MIGIILGGIALTVCFRRLRTYAEKRTDVWLLCFFGIALLLVGLFPGIVNMPASFLNMDGHQWGRIVTLLLCSNIILWFFFFYQRAKNEGRYFQFDNLVRALTVKSFLEQNSLENVEGNIIVLIPAFNEAENLHVVLAKIPAQIGSKKVHVLVLDDGSDDGTVAVTKSFNALIATHPTNRGGGAALKTGYALVTHLNPAVVLTMDGDGQHDPTEIQTLIQPILSDESDFVIGSRVLGESDKSSSIRLVGVHLFSHLINFIAGTKITDCSSGFRAIKGKVLVDCLLLQEQYHTAEVIIEAAKRKFRISERPVTISCRLSGKSKKGNDIKYGLFFLRTIVKTWLR